MNIDAKAGGQEHQADPSGLRKDSHSHDGTAGRQQCFWLQLKQLSLNKKRRLKVNVMEL